MSGLQAAQRMTSTVTLAAQAAGHDLFATIDPAAAAAELNVGTTVALVNPPTTTWETWALQVHAFEVTVISPDSDPLSAWPVLDELAQSLAEPLEVDSARLTMWQPASGDPFPCIHLTLDTTN